jgi:hypothetical protein
MGDILTVKNLTAYIRKSKNGAGPDWTVDDLLYIRLPVLAVRNYLSETATPNNWTLTWKKDRNMRMAFRMAGAILGQWQAFRPHPPAKLLQRLEKTFPRIALRFQGRILSRTRIKGIFAVRHRGKECNTLLIEMGKAIADISRQKGVPNPMLGSKLLSFFFPEFFPVWDTGWVKKRALKHYQGISLPEDVQKQFQYLPHSEAAVEYATYVYLMLIDLWSTKPSELTNLRRACYRECEKMGYYEPEVVIEDNYRDITPLLFEMCLLGKHC